METITITDVLKAEWNRKTKTEKTKIVVATTTVATGWVALSALATTGMNNLGNYMLDSVGL